MNTQRRLAIMTLAALSIALGVAASPVTQFRETWVENIWKWHQGPLFAVLAIAAIAAICVPLDRAWGRTSARVAGTIFALAGFIKSPILLALFIYPEAVLGQAGLTLICVLALWATAITVLVGVSRQATRVAPHKPAQP